MAMAMATATRDVELDALGVKLADDALSLAICDLRICPPSTSPPSQ